MEIEKNPPSDYDGAWKEGMKRHFASFMGAYFPVIAAEIDWSVPLKWLDKELEKLITHSHEKGKRTDLLVKVHLRNGEDKVILLHVEIQSNREKKFAKRLHRYWAGIFFHTGMDVITLAVLADLDKGWHPKQSVIEFGNFNSSLRFGTCKLLEFLEGNSEPKKGLPHEVARAQIAALRTTGDPAARYEAKKKLLFGLYDKGYSADDVREIFWLVDHMIILNRQMESDLRQNILEIETAKEMPFITSIERLGIERGKSLEALKSTKLILRRLFGEIPPALDSTLQEQAVETLEALMEKAWDLNSFAEVADWLKANR